jgi:hypothetical protein
MIVSHRHRFIYLRTEKTGSTVFARLGLPPRPLERRNEATRPPVGQARGASAQILPHPAS